MKGDERQKRTKEKMKFKTYNSTNNDNVTTIFCPIVVIFLFIFDF